ncbi:DUF732 domain-containing protein [Rhodococcus sp. D2-41]|uniref:DUF732 domain-containing protein n=1 Tax=Speluncibacter jeojiensis TaxID=2710754 RepID=A0A9X4M4B9_9ACTN|nr:DUF732 domain-containing protein [Rhodococcus sp. D2-41]MDG3010444.1 DUF732 domain-containing protein [Rhodococcus sp. D2-41]MDG3014191.1 DUF732 domain-containing protein [Corynebacteriales bacterium D3-21]
MMRNAVTRGIVATAVVASGIGLLAGCGSNDSTASGKPSVSAAAKPTATAAAPQQGGSTAPGGSHGDAGAAAPAPTIDPDPTGVAATAPPETPEALPQGFPGPTQPPRSPKDQAFLDQLDKAGVKVGNTGDIALTTANYICSALQAKVPTDQVTTTVTAITSSQSQLTGSKLKPADSAAIYIKVAKEDFCNS